MVPLHLVQFGDWPGRIVAGAGAVARLGEEVSRLDCARALVICGSTVARTDMLSKVRAGLGPKLAGVFAEVSAHTPVEMVKRGVEQVRASKADILVSVGGGSAIDAGKAIAIMLATGGDLHPYAIRYAPGGEMLRIAIPDRGIAHIAVPTTAGSASDVMPTAACRDPQSRKKLLFWDHKLVPQATILDPEMAVYTDARLTAATGMTAVARCIETLYSGHRHPVSTGLALHALRLLRRALPRSVEAPRDLDARADCQVAAIMSGMAAINAMVSVVHAVGHVVGGRHALQHGLSHAILLAPAMRLLLPTIGTEQELVLEALGARGSGVTGDAAAAAAALMTGFVAGLPLPHRLRDLGVAQEELAEVAHLTMSDYMMANLPRPLSEEDVLRLLQEAW